MSEPSQSEAPSCFSGMPKAFKHAASGFSPGWAMTMTSPPSSSSLYNLQSAKFGAAEHNASAISRAMGGEFSMPRYRMSFLGRMSSSHLDLAHSPRRLTSSRAEHGWERNNSGFACTTTPSSKPVAKPASSNVASPNSSGVRPHNSACTDSPGPSKLSSSACFKAATVMPGSAWKAGSKTRPVTASNNFNCNRLSDGPASSRDAAMCVTLVGG
mmetsp:Transcript_88566/g.223021  ORF Transcript_88566/g.223021 Transcript_88566/m.223021 type:complete len:213 (+) Transcript_88566:351-989(+)